MSGNSNHCFMNNYLNGNRQDTLQAPASFQEIFVWTFLKSNYQKPITWNYFDYVFLSLSLGRSFSYINLYLSNLIMSVKRSRSHYLKVISLYNRTCGCGTFGCGTCSFGTCGFGSCSSGTCWFEISSYGTCRYLRWLWYCWNLKVSWNHWVLQK